LGARSETEDDARAKRERRQGQKRRPGQGGLRHALVFFLTGLAIFIAGSVRLGLYPPVPIDLGGLPNLDSRAERVSISVGEDDHLDGWLLPGRRPALVILLHGYGRDHTSMWCYGHFLHDAGYTVLATDFRSSRMRDRKPTTLGFWEQNDARAILAWVARQPGLREDRIGVMGESLGGSVALTIAPSHPEVRALVVDSPFATGHRALSDGGERFFHVAREPFAAVARWTMLAFTHHDPYALNCIAACESLTTRPVFFIHSLRDDRLSPDQSRDLWRATGSNAVLWVVPVAGHTQAWVRYRSEYERRVLAFFAGPLGVGERR
jgi:pimeloyl-ACP methyl ester carboxylesterase